jgi:hypothetical protein
MSTTYFLYPEERYPDYELKTTGAYNEPWTIQARGQIDLTDEEYREFTDLRRRYDAWMERLRSYEYDRLK